MKLQLNKILSITLAVIVIFSIVETSTAYAKSKESSATKQTLTETNKYSSNEYNKDDVEIINNIIEENGLFGLEKDDPENWNYRIGWSNETPQRVINLNFGEQNLTGVLDVSGLSSLEKLDCNRNELTGLDVSGLSNLKELDCSQNRVRALDITGLTGLRDLNCDSNRITMLDVSTLTNLEKLSCYMNLLGVMDVSGLTNLKSLNCAANYSLETLNVLGAVNLEELCCSYDSLRRLDTASLTSLKSLDCKGNQFATLNITELTSLENLDCSFNEQPMTLNASGLANLEKLKCYDSQLTKLSLSGATNLKHLDCMYNQLTTLDVSGLTSLGYLRCTSNQLTKLNVSGLTCLDTVECDLNQLTTLDASGATSLFRLNCDENKLRILDTSRTTNLGELYCSSNQLTALDVSDSANLGSLRCSDNPLVSLKLADGKQLTIGNATNGTVRVVGINVLTRTITLEATPEWGATFTKWQTNEETLTNTTDNPIRFTLDGNITITPIYTSSIPVPSTYTVNFDANGGANLSEKKRTVDAGDTIGTLPTVERAGYVFDGWYTAPTDGTKVTATTEVTTDLILYAQWREITAPGDGIIFDRSTGIITGYSGNASEVAIPKIIEGVEVISIGEDAFKDCSVEKITIPNSVRHIGEWAFSGCKKLQSVTLPDSVTSIGKFAFVNCINLKSIIIPNGVVSIDDDTFNGCESLTSITIPNSVKYIGNWAFAWCTKLTNVIIPNGVTSIGEGAFSTCERLTSITIPDSVTSIGLRGLGYKSIGTEAYFKVPNFTIYGYSKTSAAAKYATSNGFRYINKGTEPVKQSTQVINGSNSFTKVYGNKPFNLNAKAQTKLSYRSSNTKVATVNSAGKVTIKGTGKTTITITAAQTSSYGPATKEITITVKPKQATLSKIKAGKKSLKATWERDTKATGYQIIIAKDSKFKKGKKTATITKNKTTSKTFKKLSAKKKYYVKVRAYKTVGKTKLYGAYSKTKKLKVK